MVKNKMPSHAIEHLFEAAKIAILDGAELSWRVFNLAAPGANDRYYQYARPGQAVDPFSYWLVHYYPFRPSDSWTRDLAGALGLPLARLHGMIHGTLYPQDLARYTDADYEAGVRDGQELWAKVESFVELGSGENNPNYGKKASDATRAKLSVARRRKKV